ncbi:cyclic di-GMP receptor LapD [Azotobacter chroococcum]|uniref:Diguanylate cyclase/phosphodiesterase n=1 Tax=Azotobacter chroococcum TaxID=353 RepID=A0A4R1PHP0_9GAMM|nr:EAL domain-containing protein [Azotobacter chroococcum]TBV96987.1 EAL domain-containing protein [Azotobacter chroococcum]TCL27747.1 diguanylate cyclase/phosphodiesterase [Azotobacter chroococcum]
MSLFKQLLIAICLFLLVAFAGSFVVSLETSRGQYANQLRAHAQDAATALGLSLAPHIDDPAMAELMVSSIFDSGYYSSIRVVGLDDRLIVERQGGPDGGNAPDWFARLVGLRAEGADAIVSRGWQQAARVEVISHPLFAIDRLWQSALGWLGWLLLCGSVSAVLGALLLRRQLRPLDYLVEQSRAIARREFLSLPELPRTPELRRVVEAMNQMVEKLKALFREEALRSERLHAEAYRDSLTGLGNRRHFDLQLQSRLTGEERASSGFMLLLRIDDLVGLNQRLGGQRADRLLVAVAEQLRLACAEHDLLARTRGGEFAILAAGLERDAAERLAERLDQAMSSLYHTGACDRLPVAHIGLTPFSAGEVPGDLYRALDEALAQASSQSGPRWACGEPGTVAPPADERDGWYRRLDHALREGLFQLHFQPVVGAGESGRVLHYKVLARLPDGQDRLLPAGQFLPWLERFGWSTRLDLTMLEQVLRHLEEHDGQLALSLTGATLRDPLALERLAELLQHHSRLGERLILEADEEQLPEPGALEALVRRLHELGFALGVQHFGGRFSLIGNLARLGLAYLKVDGSYIRDIDREEDKRLFIEAMYRATHSIDLPLIAERVESDGEWQVVQAMGFAGGQGRRLGEPAPWAWGL